MGVINHKFNLDDEVFFIRKTTERVADNLDCPLCDGSGEISNNNYTIQCPSCAGIKKVIKQKEAFIVESSQVVEISVYVRKNTQTQSEGMPYYYFENGNGAVENNVFDDYTKAMAECTKKNKELKTSGKRFRYIADYSNTNTTEG